MFWRCWSTWPLYFAILEGVILCPGVHWKNIFLSFLGLIYQILQPLGVARWKIWFLCKSWYPSGHYRSYEYLDMEIKSTDAFNDIWNSDIFCLFSIEVSEKKCSCYKKMLNALLRYIHLRIFVQSSDTCIFT